MFKCFQRRPKHARAFKIKQFRWRNIFNIYWRKRMPNGIVAGQTGTFAAAPLPVGSVVTGPPTWTTGNPLAVWSVNPSDVTGLSGSVAVDPTFAPGSFTLIISSTNPDGSVATGTLVVPVTAPAPPVVQSFTITQTS
jgi:hypothetical protein